VDTSVTESFTSALHLVLSSIQNNLLFLVKYTKECMHVSLKCNKTTAVSVWFQPNQQKCSLL